MTFPSISTIDLCEQRDRHVFFDGPSGSWLELIMLGRLIRKDQSIANVAYSLSK